MNTLLDIGSSAGASCAISRRGILLSGGGEGVKTSHRPTLATHITLAGNLQNRAFGQFTDRNIG